LTPDIKTAQPSSSLPVRGGAALSPTLRLVIAGVLTALLAAAVIVGVLSFQSLQTAEAEEDARRDAVRVAESFTAEVNNYDAGTIDSSEENIGSLLSTKFRAEFEKAMQDIVTSVQEAQMKSKGTVLTSGVASIDQDSARVLVVADADVETVFDKRQRHFRWQVSLVKVDDKWLVDDFTPVA
jgi:Mce-associated membrane protein